MTDVSQDSSVGMSYSLSDAIGKSEGSVFATGTQALVRLLVAQRRLDLRQGLDTAGFVSGYRGSPLAGLDTELWRSADILKQYDIRFLPGVNEDLAATAVSGTQRVESDPDRRVDGVFAMWYGKGPGVDRAGDAIHHGHAAGASRLGGVLMIVGDDHAATSSSIPNASDLSLMGWMLPIVHPASVADYVEFGLWGWAASRYSGAWIALKAISETVESSRSFVAAPLPTFTRPTPMMGSIEDLGYATAPFLTPEIERRMVLRLDRLKQFARANSLDRTLVVAPEADIGIVAVGKSSLDILETFARLGLDEAALDRLGIRIWRPGLVYPLDTDGLAVFAQGLKHILVVEEKASLVESQIKDQLYNLPNAKRPTVSGKADLEQRMLISVLGQHRPSSLARPLLRWLSMVRPALDLSGKVVAIDRPAPLSNRADGARRLPYFCSGCPHNSSTKVPEGSEALAGVGCHYMASWMDRQTAGLTQMGAEGADWVGQHTYTKRSHVFQNMGEGTYYHSGYLAIRQSIASGANITYKVLFNDAVAMTGGQPVDGPIGVPQIVNQMVSEGARFVVVVTDQPERYAGISLPTGVAVHHRRELDELQRMLRTMEGVTVLVFDQTCAAEKRRRRKRGRYPDPDRRMVINSEVCEGCGDCGKASNCLSIAPLETALGRKRVVDQTTCNKDYSCADGFCPSFVSVVGGQLRRKKADDTDWCLATKDLVEPAIRPLGQRPRNLLIAGVGGTGVITIGAIAAMAAHLDGVAVSALDFTALAQKGGSVMCHLRFAAPGASINQPRIDWNEADAVLVADLIVGCLPDSLGTIRVGVTKIIANTHVGAVAEFVHDPDADPHAQDLLAKLHYASGPDQVKTIDAHRAAIQAFGDATATNMLLLGMAWQQGLVPVSHSSIERAIELNGVSVSLNKQAFSYGRLLAERGVGDLFVAQTQQPLDWKALVDDRVSRLVKYQDSSYAARYRAIVEAAAAAERHAMGPSATMAFAQAVGQSLYKLMAYKDEYEVARLLTEPAFAAIIARQFEGDYSLRYHLAPASLSQPENGHKPPAKITFGPWLRPVLCLLAKLKGLRNGPFDPFRSQPERRLERQLIADYQTTIERLQSLLSPETIDIAVDIAAVPLSIRGYGHVKARNAAEASDRQRQLFDQLKQTSTLPNTAMARTP